MDYTQFLQQPGAVLRLPYFGGKSVCDDKLTYRLRETLQPGWYQFLRSGRYLTADGPIEPELDAWKLPRATGYVSRRLDVPTDNGEVVATALTAMADVAGGLSFIPEEVDKERGVVIEEWRGRLGAGSRIRDKQLPVIFFQSRYAERLPIGKPEIIRGAPVERLRAFYNTWYRPERMAIIDRLILRMATCELMRDAATPRAVVINEALELARTFSTDESVGFINGMLDAIRKKLETK